MIIAAFVMLGWFLEIPILTRLNEAFPSMKFNTALSFFLMGLTMWFYQHRVRYLLVIIVCILGISSMFQSILGVDLFLEELFVEDFIENSGLMSSATAICFLLMSVGWIIRDSENRKTIQAAHLLFNTVSIISFLSLIGYTFGIETSDRLEFMSSMALHTSVLFIVISTGSLLPFVNVGISKIFIGANSGSKLAKKMYLLLILAVLFVGFGVVRLARAGLVSLEGSITLTGVLILVVSLIGVTLIAFQLFREEEVRTSLEHKLKRINTELETQVEKRTKELKETVDLLNRTNDSAKIGYWTLDVNTHEVSWSAVTRTIHEVDSSFVPDYSTGVQFYKSEKDKQDITNAVTKAANQGVSWDLELEIITAQGNVKWVRTIGFAEHDSAGNCVKIAGTFQDIHERKMAEIKLSEERQFLQLAIDTIPVNVYAKDLESRKTLVNKQELELLGVSNVEDVLGKNDFDLYPEESAKISRAEDLKVFETGESYESEETSIQFSDGRQEWFITSKIPFKDFQGVVKGLIGVSVNITERKKLEYKLQNYAILEAKAKEMEQLAYIASHDLKEPLLTVKAYISELFADFGHQLDGEARYFQKTIEKGIDRMQTLVDGLLDYSRASAREELKVINVRELLGEVCESLSQTIEASGAIIQKDFELPDIKCYPIKLRSLFQNLISNGIKYQDEQTPKIQVSAEQFDEYWQFCIADNGIGIESQYYDQIFSMFKRLHSRHEYEGTGIGLAQCQKIVEFHNGKIWVESVKGKGSNFYFTIAKDL